MNMEEIVDGIAARAKAGRTVGENDYIDSTGLLRCGVCNELKECKIEFNGITRTVSCLCGCELEKRENRKREARQKELEDLRKNWVKGYEDMTFENGQDTRLMAFAEKYVRNWKKILENGISYTLTGNVGCGKTYACAAIANRILSMDYRVWIATTATMLDMLLTEPERVHNRLATFDLVVIDDFGAERNTEFAAEKMFQIIDERTRSHLPTLVTTNLNIDQVAPDVTYRRMFSRLKSIGAQIQSGDTDMRQKIGQDRAKMAAELLRGE